MTPRLACDVLVVGSGAAGSVIAYHLARAGARVVVLERGRRFESADLPEDELRAFALLYKDGGAQTNTAADMYILQGECLGGSTVLTSAVCLRLPEDVRRAFGGFGFDLPAEGLAASYARVESVLNVQPVRRSLWSPAAHRLSDGLRAIGIESQDLGKCVLGCVGCGACNLGCRHGRKLDAARTWIPMAEAHGAEVHTEVEALRVLHRRGRASGVLARSRRDGSVFRIAARRTVLAGGAINTPELLLRSGIHCDRVGRRTSFNLGTILHAEYAEPVDGFAGDPMTLCHFTPQYAIEHIHNPPVSYALTLQTPADRHHRDLGRYRHLAAAGVLVPTESVGRVAIAGGLPLLSRLARRADVRFRMTPPSVAALRDGLKEAAQAFLAAGAVRVLAPTRPALEIRRPADVAALDRLLVDHGSFRGLGSAHPQGGAPLGDDPRRDVVDPTFRAWGFEDLYVCDASVFPVSVRVNPMLTIMAVADLAVGHVGGFAPWGPILEGPAHEARRAAHREHAGRPEESVCR